MELLDLKKQNQKDKLPWGILRAMPTKFGKVIQINWKNNIFVLSISIVLFNERFMEQ
jgi:hypothetical protein